MFCKKKGGENGLRSYCNDCNYENLKKWRAKNTCAAKEIAARARTKIRNTPKGKLNSNVSREIRKSLNIGAKSNRKWTDIVGYTVEQLIMHLEKQFQPGMTWDNYGTHWHIDHIIPSSVFNFEQPEDWDFKRCWALDNLQPLSAGDNMAKGGRLIKPFQPTLLV